MVKCSDEKVLPEYFSTVQVRHFFDLDPARLFAPALKHFF